MRAIFIAALLLLFPLGFANAADDPLSRWIDVEGLKIHYLEAGRGQPDDPLLLMVHGWCGTAEDFRPVLLALPDTMRSIAVDLPGCGLSAKPDAAYDLPYFMEFLRSFCVAMGLDRFTLVGHSLGGLFAVRFTTLWPGFVEKLVLIDPYGLKGEEGALLALARLGPLVNLGFLLNNRLFIEWALTGNVLYHPRPEVLRASADATARGILGCDASRATARITRNVIGRFPVDDLLPSVRQETLVIWGDHDKLLPPQWAPRFVSLLPSVRLEMVRDAGHMPMVEKPGQTTELIVGFVRQ